MLASVGGFGFLLPVREYHTFQRSRVPRWRWRPRRTCRWPWGRRPTGIRWWCSWQSNWFYRRRRRPGRRTWSWPRCRSWRSGLGIPDWRTGWRGPWRLPPSVCRGSGAQSSSGDSGGETFFTGDDGSGQGSMTKLTWTVYVTAMAPEQATLSPTHFKRTKVVLLAADSCTSLVGRNETNRNEHLTNSLEQKSDWRSIVVSCLIGARLDRIRCPRSRSCYEAATMSSIAMLCHIYTLKHSARVSRARSSRSRYRRHPTSQPASLPLYSYRDQRAYIELRCSAAAAARSRSRSRRVIYWMCALSCNIYDRARARAISYYRMRR